MTAAELVVGVDVGSRSTRAVALDRDGGVVADAGAEYVGRDGWPIGRGDPQVWRKAVEEALARLAGAVPAAGRPAALAIGGQSPTTVAADGRRALTYQHPAGEGRDPAGTYQSHRTVLREESGRDDEPAYQLWDWLLADLGGIAASGRTWGHGQWPGAPAMEGFGSPRGTGDVVGEADGGWGVPAGTPLVTGAPDALLAFWAAGLTEPGRGCDPGGKTGGLMVAVPAGVDVPGVMGLASPADGVRIVGGPVSAHGLALDWLAGISGRAPGELCTLAESAPAGAGGVTVLPYFAGERTPRWRADLRADVVGMGLETDLPMLARAVLEGTAYGLGHIARVITTAGGTLNVVMCSGSPSRSRLWCAIKASVLEVPVEVPGYPELAAYGAALAAGAGAGWWPAPGAAPAGSWPRPGVTVVEPVPDPAYREGLDRFIALGDEAAARSS